jgi:hypothetical protein
VGCFKRIKAESPKIVEAAPMTIREDGMGDGIDEPYFENTDDRAAH